MHKKAKDGEISKKGETYAFLVSSVLGWVTGVVTRLNAACGSTGARVIALALAEGEILVAHVGVMALRIKGSIDSPTQGGRAIVA